MNTFIDELERAIFRGVPTWAAAIVVAAVIAVGLISRARASKAQTSPAREYQSTKAPVTQFTAARLKVVIDAPRGIATSRGYLESAGHDLARAIGARMQALHPTDHFIGDILLGVPLMLFSVELVGVCVDPVRFEFTVDVQVLGDEKWIPQCLDDTIKACETIRAGHERDWPRQVAQLGGIFGASRLTSFEMLSRSMTDVQADMVQYRARSRASLERP